MFREIIDCTEWSYIMRKSKYFSLAKPVSCRWSGLGRNCKQYKLGLIEDAI